MSIKTIFLIFLFKSKVWSQDYSGDTPLLKEDYEMNPKDIGINTNIKVTTKHILHLLQAMKPHELEHTTQLIKDPKKYCRSFDTCYKCVKSLWYPCSWCHNSGCTDRGDKLCPVTRNTFAVPRNLSMCPFINQKTPILIASGVRKHIVVRVNIPDPALRNNDIVCQIQLKNGMTHFKGILLKNKVYCFPVKLTITDGSESGIFNILWGGVESYSNEIPLVVFRCDALADSCEDCRQLSPEYGCGWCEDSQLCVISDKCSDVLSWTLNKVTCQFETRTMFFH